MTNQEKEKNKELQNLKQENEELKKSQAMFQDQVSLRDQSIYRQQLLILLERQAIAMEKLAESSEIPLEEEENKVEELPKK